VLMKCDVMSGSNNSEKMEQMPTSFITSRFEGHSELGNSTSSYGEGVND
jgi:hypothetical protein